jgi:hypothetical protein
MYTNYFPYGMERYLIGGMFIGLGVALLFVSTGRLGGASTFFSAAWSWVTDLPFFQQASLRDSRLWRLVYALGMVLGGVVYVALGLPTEATQVQVWRFVVGGLLIGFGARLGGGCTSGHGICGMASLSIGSMLMVAVFLSTAIVTALAMSAVGVAP